MEFKLRSRYLDHHLVEFAEQMQKLQRAIGFKVSSRGWAYILEQHRMINKDQFDKVTKLINNCRKRGFLPIDFVAEESARQFSGVENVDETSVYDLFIRYLNADLEAADFFDIDWWDGEKYYIQMVVEKVDLVTLFSPVCKKYHIPIANSKGWSSMLQRAEYARRFQEAMDKGLECVLLYCGDHDPDGLRISDFLRSNLRDLKNVQWKDGEAGYNPENLIIDRFGLNYDFIEQNKLTWIDNLITGSGKNLANPNHKNYEMPYIQDYLRDVGERKCEANAIVVSPVKARELCRDAIEKYLGKHADLRFQDKRNELKVEFNKFLEKEKIKEKINEIIKITEKYA